MVDVGVSGEATKTTLGVFAQPQVTQFAGKDWSCGNATLCLTPAQLASAGASRAKTVTTRHGHHGTTSKEQKDAQKNKQMLKEVAF